MNVALLLIGAGVMGLFVGAMLNAMVLRTRDAVLFTWRRTCSTCAVPVHPKEMLPLVGFFAMKGRCRRCQAVVPWQYPAMDAVVGLLFVLAAARALSVYMGASDMSAQTASLLFLRDAFVSAFLLFAAMFDYKAGFLPERLTVPAMIIGFAFTWWLGAPITALLLGGLAIGVLFSIQFLVSSSFVAPADIRLGMLAGFLFGPFTGLAVVALSIVLTSFAGLVLVATGKRQLHSLVPYGSFLCVSIIAGLYIGEPLAMWLIKLFA